MREDAGTDGIPDECTDGIPESRPDKHTNSIPDASADGDFHICTYFLPDSLSYLVP